LPDARQLIYQGPNNVIVKVKTMGYAGGRRQGVATMSMEITNGKGIEWDNVLCKLDHNGHIIAKNVMGNNTPLIPTVDGKFLVVTPNGNIRLNAKGEPQPVSVFEVLEGGQAKAIDKDAFADRGHMDFRTPFSPKGAATLK
jgi:hypothetical protein